MMVEVRDADQVQIAERIEIAKKMRQRHRIRAARHGGNDTRLGAGQIVLANELPNAVKHLHVSFADRFDGCRTGVDRVG